MEEENNQEETEETEQAPLALTVKTDGVCVEAFIATVIAFVVLSLLLYFGRQAPKPGGEYGQCQINNAAAVAQAESAKAQAELNTAMQRRIEDVQMQVVKDCVAGSHIPVFINGNVGCNPAPK